MHIRKFSNPCTKKSSDSSKYNNILSQQHILTVLGDQHTTPNMRTAILRVANKKLIGAICESILNFLKRNLDINDDDIANLKSYKFKLRKIINENNLKTRRQIIIQNGGFLQFLIPAVVTGIASIVSSLISSNKKEPTINQDQE